MDDPELEPQQPRSGAQHAGGGITSDLPAINAILAKLLNEQPAFRVLFTEDNAQERAEFAAKEAAKAESERAEIAHLVERATAEGYADAEVIANLCGIDRPHYRPGLAATLIKERLPIKDARVRIIDLFAEESEKFHIRARSPEFQFYPGPSDKTEWEDRCRSAILAGLRTLPPQKPGLVSASLMHLPACMAPEQLADLGVQASSEVLVSLIRLPVQALCIILRLEGMQEKLEDAQALAAALSVPIFAQAGEFIDEWDVWEAALDIAGYVNRLFSVAQAIETGLDGLRNPIAGQRAVADGIFEHTASGIPELPITWHPWGFDVLARSLSGEQRARILRGSLDGHAVVRKAFLLGICDPLTREPYFREEDLTGLPVVEVAELGRIVLWLSGMVESPGESPDYQDPLGAVREGEPDRRAMAELAFLLRWVKISASDPAERDVLHSLSAQWMLEHPRVWWNASKSICGLIGRSIKNKLTDWYKEQNNKGRLLFWSGIAKGRKNIGLDNANFFYNRPRRTQKKKTDDEEGQQEALGYILRRIRTEGPIEPATRLKQQGSCEPEVMPERPRAAVDELRLEMERLRGQMALISDMDVLPAVQRQLDECERKYQAIQRDIIRNTVRGGWVVEPCAGRTLDDFDSTVMVDCDVRSAFEVVHRRVRPLSTKPWDVLHRLAGVSREHAGQTQTHSGGWVAIPKPPATTPNSTATLGAGWRCSKCHTPKSLDIVSVEMAFPDVGGDGAGWRRVLGNGFRSRYHARFPDLSKHRESWVTSCGCRVEKNLVLTRADVEIPKTLDVSRTPGYELTNCILCKLPNEVRLRVPKLEGRHICSLMMVAWPPSQRGLEYHGRLADRDTQVIVHHRQPDGSIDTVWWQHQAEMTKFDMRVEIFKLMHLDNFNECDLAEKYGEKRVRAAAEWMRAHWGELEREFQNGGWRRRRIASGGALQVA